MTTETTIAWNEIDEGIRGPLRVLTDAGIDTFSSCEGGGYGRGHGYLRPTICFNGTALAEDDARNALEKAGYVIFQIMRRFIDGKPVYWQIEFVSGAAHGR